MNVPELIKQAKLLIAQQEKLKKFDECGHSSCITLLREFVKSNDVDQPVVNMGPVNVKSSAKV